MKVRLDKFLADMGVGTRSGVKTMIRKGAAAVNGSTCLNPEQKVDTELDEVTWNKKIVSYCGNHYYMLNKPAGVVTATQDAVHTTVLDLLGGDRIKGLFPVGRLDKDTEGLLLITDDGTLAHELLSPKKHVDKVYFARVAGSLTQADAQAFAEGLTVPPEEGCGSDDGFTALEAELCILETGDYSEAIVTLREGKYHQVKRMFAVCGKKVLYLKRLSIGGLTLDEQLQPGQYRELHEAEILKLCGIKKVR